MFQYYSQDDLGYLHLNNSVVINETYTINPLDISWLIHIDIDEKSFIAGIEVIPASYISNLEKLNEINQIYLWYTDTLIIEFISLEADSIIINDWSFYDPPHLLNGNIQIWLFNNKIVYFKITNASIFFPQYLLDNKNIEIMKLP